MDRPMHNNPDMKAELEAFNEFRRQLLNGRPIDPDGEDVLIATILAEQEAWS